MLNTLALKTIFWAVITVVVAGGGYWSLQSWHYNPLEEQANKIFKQNGVITVYEVEINSLYSEKHKLMSDMSVVYDNGYEAGFKEGYKYEKSDTATIHSTTLRF